MFAKNGGLRDRPLILQIDEADTISPALTDLMVAQFRELYLHRETSRLHGLALIGVCAVLGIQTLGIHNANDKSCEKTPINRIMLLPIFFQQDVSLLWDMAKVCRFVSSFQSTHQLFDKAQSKLGIYHHHDSMTQ